MTETVDCHGHDIDHEVTEKVETLKRIFPPCKLEHLRDVVKGETRVGDSKPYLDQFTGRILHLGLKEIDVRRYIMGDVSLLADEVL